MNLLSIIIAVVLGLLITVLTAALIIAILYNVKVGARYREPLAAKLQSLRLNKMLVALGIDTYQYLHKENVVTIHDQMKRCSECDNTQECDETLSDNSVDADSFVFCNNESSLKEMLSKQHVTD